MKNRKLILLVICIPLIIFNLYILKGLHDKNKIINDQEAELKLMNRNRDHENALLLENEKAIEVLDDQLQVRGNEIIDLNKEVDVFYEDIKEMKNNLRYEFFREDKILLREGNYPIKLYAYYKNTIDSDYLEVSPLGPIATLNPFAYEHTYALTIIGQESEQLTRVSINCLVPSWLLIDASDQIQPMDFDDKEMYIIRESDLFLSPEDISIKVVSFNPGKAVRVLDEHEDYYYISAYSSRDSNEIGQGWIKKSNLGYYESFDTNIGIEVNVKKGFEPESYAYYRQTQYGLWGFIYQETEDSYVLSTVGAGVITVKKENVKEFIYNKE